MLPLLNHSIILYTWYMTVIKTVQYMFDIMELINYINVTWRVHLKLIKLYLNKRSQLFGWINYHNITSCFQPAKTYRVFQYVLYVEWLGCVRVCASKHSINYIYFSNTYYTLLPFFQKNKYSYVNQAKFNTIHFLIKFLFIWISLYFAISWYLLVKKISPLPPVQNMKHIIYSKVWLLVPIVPCNLKLLCMQY